MIATQHTSTYKNPGTLHSFLVRLPSKTNYWPKATMSFERSENPLILSATHNGTLNARFCCLLTPKLCDLLSGDEAEPYKIKTICFKIVSHDQGWCSSNFFSSMIFCTFCPKNLPEQKRDATHNVETRSLCTGATWHRRVSQKV